MDSENTSHRVSENDLRERYGFDQDQIDEYDHVMDSVERYERTKRSKSSEELMRKYGIDPIPEYGTEEWRKAVSKIIVELSKDKPKVGYTDEDGNFVMPADFRD